MLVVLAELVVCPNMLLPDMFWEASEVRRILPSREDAMQLDAASGI
jgi:hypothetical protein